MKFLNITKRQRIRLGNTSLAAIGGAVLTLVMVFAYFDDGLVVSGKTLVAAIIVFWIVNLSFIFCIIFSFNLKFADPAMSLLQMYWAIIVSMVAIFLAKNIEVAIYPLILLTMVFGLFRVDIRQFNTLCAFVIVGVFCVHVGRVTILMSAPSTLPLWAGWLTFGFCSIGLTVICNAIVDLRNRLRRNNDQLKDALQTKNYFLANVSHEIRTPINGILGMLDAALCDEPSSQQSKYLKVAKNSTRSLICIVDDILDFSKIDAGNLELQPSVVNVTRLVSDAVLICGVQAKQKNLELILDISNDIPSKLIIDPDCFRRILNNLVSNALKFTEKGEIVVKLKADVSDNNLTKLQLEVIDTGIGIAQQKQSTIFESFAQSDVSSTRQFGGLGLGLSITKQLCRLMGGDISVSSELGGGSVFRAFVKAKNIDDDSRKPFKPLDFYGTTILLVEDNSRCRDVLNKQLIACNIEVLQAAGGREALALIKKQKLEIDLALVDMQMPDMNGTELIKELRNIPELSEVAIVMLYADTTEVEATFVEKYKVAALLQKPVSTEQLYDTLKFVFAATGRLQINQSIVASSETKHTQVAKQIVDVDINTSDKKILLVEDNLINQEVAIFILHELGYSVDVAGNGKLALTMLLQSLENNISYDAILMDCQMPVMDGYRATKEIRRLENINLKSTPIIAMTANTMSGDRQKCLQAGMDDYIAKPISNEVLQQTLNQWLNTEPIKQDEINNCKLTSELPSQEVAWDIKVLKKLMRNNEDRIVKLLCKFIESLVRSSKNIYAAFAQSDYAMLRRYAHELKGTSSNIGARTLPKVLKQVEQYLQENNHQAAQDLLPTIRVEIDKLQDEINHYLSQSDKR